MNQTDNPRVAIITGASQGIGAGLVSAFRSAGYAVVGTSLSIRPSEAPDFLTLQGDIAQIETAQRVVQQALDRFGRIDSLVNNAGIYIGKPFIDYTADDFVAITAVNLAGFFHITQRAVRPMIAQGGGHVVNVTTSLVDHADSRRPSALASLTKGGLAAVTRSLAIEYASRGVRVNAVALGVIRTPIHDAASYAGMASLHPLGRVGEISDVVDGIMCLERAPFVPIESNGVLVGMLSRSDVMRHLQLVNDSALRSSRSSISRIARMGLRDQEAPSGLGSTHSQDTSLESQGLLPWRSPVVPPPHG